jgi:MFS transporter, ACS family, tartrate transporter
MVSSSALLQAVVGTSGLEDGRERRVLGQVTWRLIPFIFIGYVIAYIDRVNIGFAARSMQADLGLSNTAFGHGAALFFIGYALFEIPSNLILQRVGARVWIARIMIVWGLVSMGMVFVTDTMSFYVLRVLLGIAEAGFFPGMILYLTYWIPARQRAKTGALFMTAIPIAMMVGPWVSEALLTLDGRALFGWTLQGWQWLFLVEGLPAVLLGILAFVWLTDRPEKAHWLAPDDRAWLSEEMNRERAAKGAHAHTGALQALGNPKVLLLCLFYFLNNMATYGVFFFLPKILAEASGYTGMKLAAISSLPFMVALVGMVLIGRHSDRTGERKWHVAACALTAAGGLLLATLFPHNLPLIVFSFALSQLGQRAILGVFWAIPPMFLGGAAAAAGIATINAVGNLGGYFGPDLMGRLRDVSSGYSIGLWVLAAGLIAEALLVLSLRLPSPSPGTGAPPAPTK